MNFFKKSFPQESSQGNGFQAYALGAAILERRSIA
jgi:hypothetical protein